MQHILNIAFDFDDEKVKSIAEAKIESEMDSIITKIVTDHIAPMEKAIHYPVVERRSWTSFDRKTETIVKEFLESNRDEIIERAVYKLVDSYKRTRVWKDKARNALDEVERHDD